MDRTTTLQKACLCPCFSEYLRSGKVMQYLRELVNPVVASSPWISLVSDPCALRYPLRYPLRYEKKGCTAGASSHIYASNVAHLGGLKSFDQFSLGCQHPTSQNTEKNSLLHLQKHLQSFSFPHLHSLSLLPMAHEQ